LVCEDYGLGMDWESGLIRANGSILAHFT